MKVSAYTLYMVKDSGDSKKLGPILKQNITDPSEVSKAIYPLFDGMDREMFGVLALNTRNQIIGFNTVAVGTLDSAIVHPREVYKFAVLSNAHSVILFHNHPSGDTNPSSDDINLTRRLIEAGEYIDIKVLDHIILGEDGEFCSMKARNLV